MVGCCYGLFFGFIVSFVSCLNKMHSPYDESLNWDTIINFMIIGALIAGIGQGISFFSDTRKKP
jgi:hypothetical protein